MSGQRIATGTGTGVARRRLTVTEAEAGGLPEPFTPDEWKAMHLKSALHGLALLEQQLNALGR